MLSMQASRMSRWLKVFLIDTDERTKMERLFPRRPMRPITTCLIELLLCVVKTMNVSKVKGIFNKGIFVVVKG